MTWALAASFLVISLWQIVLISSAALIMTNAIDERAAALKHAILMFALVACLVTPFLSAFSAAPAAEDGLPDGPGHWQEFDIGLTAAWVVGICMQALRLVVSWLAFQKLDRAPFLPLPDEWLARARDTQFRLRIKRVVTLRISGSGLPSTARFFRPVIFLPAVMFSSMSTEQIEAVIAHELAHIKRCDWLWNGLQITIESLLFYHPAVWLLSKRIRQEREHACDDLALSGNARPIALVEALAFLEGSRSYGRLALSIGGGSLLERTRRLLDAQSSTLVPRRISNAQLITLLALLMVGLGSLPLSNRADASDREQRQPIGIAEVSISRPAKAMNELSAPSDKEMQIKDRFRPAEKTIVRGAQRAIPVASTMHRPLMSKASSLAQLPRAQTVAPALPPLPPLAAPSLPALPPLPPAPEAPV